MTSNGGLKLDLILKILIAAFLAYIMYRGDFSNKDDSRQTED